MAIIITDSEPDIKLTSTEYTKYLQEYSEAFRFHSGVRPTFEDWVKTKLQQINEQGPTLLNESAHR